MTNRLRLPANVRLDPNSGMYLITNGQGKTVRVVAQTQSQLDAYVRSVNTNAPIQVTITDPTTGLPRVTNFNPVEIISETDQLQAWRDTQTQVKRRAGIIGTTNPEIFADIETGQAVSLSEAQARVRQAGLPTSSLQTLRPLDEFKLATAQQELDVSINRPSQLETPNQIYTPPQPDVVSVQAFALEGQDVITGTPLPDRLVPPALDVVETGNSTIFFEDGIETGRVAFFGPPPVGFGTDVQDTEPGITTLFDNAGVTTNFAPVPVSADPGTFDFFDEAGSVAGRTTLFDPPDVDTANDPGVFPQFDEAGVQTGTTTVFAANNVSLATLSDAELDNLIATTPRSDGGFNLLVQEFRIRNPGTPLPDGTAIDPNAETDENAAGFDGAEGARQQPVLDDQRREANAGDWRVKLRLAPGANYLYKAGDSQGRDAGILQPLAATDGVVFPYTPRITTSYNANYTPYDLTHSNFRGYFYQNSYVSEITLTAVFTAQDTFEANYLLAVIHFFRSVTKMFYGQDPQRGVPPPLVFLQGLGEFQFNLHPCVVSSFNYNLPDDVDYIRARSTNFDGTNLLIRRDRQTIPNNPFDAALERLRNGGLTPGALNVPPPPPTLGTNSPTYVPTKMEITLTLLPIQTRQQQSTGFSLRDFSNGGLITRGFW